MRRARAAGHRGMRLRALLATMLIGMLAGASAQSVPDAAEPASAAPGPQWVRVRPSEADPAVKSFDEPNLVVFDSPVAAAAPLAVFLPGTSGRPENAQRLLGVIAGQGYRVIGLEYDDEPAVVQVCPQRPDPACSAKFRQQRVFGNAEGAPVANPVEQSIVRRLVMLLRHLDRTRPDEHWSDYLAGDEPAWSRIVVSGLSQGAGMAAYIAKRRAVARVVLFSSPWDFHGANRTLAPWLAEPSATPPERWYAELHRRENTAALIAQAYRLLQIPADHVQVFDLDLPNGGSGGNPFHGSTVRLPGYAAQWRWLYGAAAEVGGPR